MLYNTSMPFNYAHALTGQYVLENCKMMHQVGIDTHSGAYFLGTMGPDPFYGDALPPTVFTRPRTDLADMLHALDACTLATELMTLSEGSAVRMAYTAGFLCHVLLDNRVHPYIESRFSGKLHTPAEIAMDPMLVALADDRRFSVSPAAFYCADDADEIDALLAGLFRSHFALDTRGVYRRALHKWLRLNAFLYDPHGRKRSATRWLPRLSQYFIAPRSDGDDLLNLRHRPWSPPWDSARVSTASVPELIEAGKAEIVSVLDGLFSADRETALIALEGRTADAAGDLPK